MFFFFKQKTAYEMRISDWSSDVCSSDLAIVVGWATDHAIRAAPMAAHIRHDLPQRVDRVERGGAAGGEIAEHHADQCRDREGEIGRASCRERECQYV